MIKIDPLNAKVGLWISNYLSKTLKMLKKCRLNGNCQQIISILEDLGALICNRVTIISRKKRVEKILHKIQNSLRTKTSILSSSNRRLSTLKLFKVLSTEKQEINKKLAIDNNNLKKLEFSGQKTFKK